ncbi:anosmin-1 isoform X2 [Agrilus planipennis]|uniref:Anosmin-1 isoform X2 n=1 Tax=Agrilus planipennis TaxID=224129 RepID=A0A1W4W7G4_AGRPL|nr:anosmin-1 isoform X2 [Agrilus planipennis]
MIAVVLLICATVFVEFGGFLVVAGTPRQRQKFLLHLHEQFDPLVTVICEARCWNTTNKNRCVKACLMKGVDKPGSCPGLDSTGGSRFAFACLEACNKDIHCPGLTKCCNHRCGITCQIPKNLNNVKDVPELPTNLIVREQRRKRSLMLKWEPGGSPPGIVLYLVEERHHIGKYLVENRMSHWTPCIRTPKPKIVLKKILKPGRWYQFRVTAVNKNGTKGYSEPSRFVTSSVPGPRPPKPPENITVELLSINNSSMNFLVKWTPPYSDLPIQKYKVFWSRRLKGIINLDSVLVHHKTVQKVSQKNFTLLLTTSTNF